MYKVMKIVVTPLHKIYIQVFQTLVALTMKKLL